MVLKKLAKWAVECGFDRPFTHRRHAVLIISMLLLLMLIFVQLALVLSNLDTTLYVYRDRARNLTARPFDDLSDGSSDTSLQIISNTTRYLGRINILNTLYFCIFWHRWHHVYLRSALAASLGALPVVLNAIGLAASGSIMILPSDLENSLIKYSELSLADLEAFYVSWKTKFRAQLAVDLAVNLAVALVQGVAIAFWIWLLPSRWRKPNNYEPIISSRQKRRRVRYEDPETELQRLLVTTNDDGYLAGIFKEHEREFMAQSSPFPMHSINTTTHRPQRRPDRLQQGDSGEVRYMRSVPFWASNTWELEEHGRFLYFGSISWVSVTAVMELLKYTLLRPRMEQNKWTYIAGSVSVLFWLSVAGTVILLIRLKVSFGYEILGLLTVRTLIYGTMVTSSVLLVSCNFSISIREQDARQPGWQWTLWFINLLSSAFHCIMTLIVGGGILMKPSTRAHRKSNQVEPPTQVPDEQLEQQRQARQSKWKETKKAWQRRHRKALIYGRQAGRATATFLTGKAIPVLVSPLGWLIKGVDTMSMGIMAFKARDARRARERIARSEYEITLD